MKNRICKVVCFLTLISALLLPTGCKGSSPGEYTKFTRKEGPASFSFEYPSTFSKPTVDTANLNVWIRVSTSGVPPESERGYESIYMDVYFANSAPNSSAKLERDLIGYQELRGFRLLDRKSINVAGSSGELIVFSYNGFATLIPVVRPLDMSDIGTAYFAYFDHGGFIWKVRLIADEDGTKYAKVHFQHILKTFEFLT